MGHVRLGILPATRSWKAVVGLIADGADVKSVASATWSAADKAFEAIQKDPGFAEASDLLTQLAVAAKKPNPSEHLATHGFALSAHSSIAEVADAIHRTLDAKAYTRGSLTDFGEVAQNALVGAVTSHLENRLGPLYTPAKSEVHAELAKLGRPAEFGALARTFFDRLSRSCLDYFLSKTLNSKVGVGHRFATTTQVAEFQEALAKHTHEVSAIVEKYSAEWFSSNHYKGGGEITRRKAAGFGWHAVTKIRAEMRVRSEGHAN